MGLLYLDSLPQACSMSIVNSSPCYLPLHLTSELFRKSAAQEQVIYLKPLLMLEGKQGHVTCLALRPNYVTEADAALASHVVLLFHRKWVPATLSPYCFRDATGWVQRSSVCVRTSGLLFPIHSPLGCQGFAVFGLSV